MCANQPEAAEGKLPNGLGLKIVSVAPTRYTNRTAASKKQTSPQQIEKQAWHGVDLAYIGQPQGLDRYPLPPNLKALEIQCSAILQWLQSDVDTRPPLIKFFPVRESQLVTESGQQSYYPKSTALQGQELVYRLYHAEGRLVRSILEQAGFTGTDSHDWNVLWTGTVPPRYLFEGLFEYQKINHYPRTEELTRKDRMYVNVSRMRERFGREHFDFLPETYLLPEEFSEFSSRFAESSEVSWIAKPNASSQGKGIFIIESIADAIVTEPYVVMRYICNPLLIDNLKFDLRIYVLVSSYDPLRIYVYEEGLARFASEEYQPVGCKKNRFVHLTNYSVNKKNEKFVQNQDFRKDNVGHKWSLSALFQHLRTMDIDTELLWLKIYDAIIKSILAIEEIVIDASMEAGINRSNCFDLFGFDILIDSGLKPWVLEVNLSPSLATDSPLDLHIKAHLIADTFNLVGVRTFDRKKESVNKAKARLRAKRSLSGKPVPAPTKAHPIKSPEPGTSWRLKDVVRDSAEEYLRRGHFLRIYPSKGCECYDSFFAVPRVANKYIARVLFSDADALAKDAESLLNPNSRPQTSLQACASERRVDIVDLQQKTYDSRPSSVAYVRRGLSASASRKLPFSDEDLLVEYTLRLVGALGKTNERNVHRTWKTAVETFVANTGWSAADLPQEPLWRRVENRYCEMKERRAKNSRLGSRPSQSTLSSLSNAQLEQCLRQLSPGQIRDLVQPLLRRNAGGVLSDLSHPQQRSHTLSQLHCLPHNSDEEESTGVESRKRSLEPITSLYTLRSVLKPSTRLSTRKIVRTIRR